MVLKTLFLKSWVVYMIHQIFAMGVTESPGPEQSGMAGYGVWYNVSDILDILNQDVYQHIPAVRATVSTYHELLDKPAYDAGSDPPLERRQPFIAVESTHRRSRIIIGKELASFLSATYLNNPPRSMLPLRKLFDREKGMIRKAYFSLSFYVGAHHVREIWTKEPVITAGYWLDQAAFSIAQRFSEALPPPDSPLYQWPEDLLKPDVAFFLNIPQMKWGERESNPFKPRLAEVYRRIKGVKVIEINQTGVYRKIFSIMRSHLGNMFKFKFDQAGQEAQVPEMEATDDYDQADYNR